MSQNPSPTPSRNPGENPVGHSASEAPQAPVSQGQSTPSSPSAPRASEQDRHPRTARPRRDPKLDGHDSGPGAGVWATLIVGILVLIMLLVFILQNMDDVSINYLPWTFALPLGVAMLLAAIAGALVMGLVGSVRLFALNRRVRKLEKERELIKSTIG